ncbi:TIGR03767 family metallophosphoesterase [Nocardioides mangrovi]|uniref:TIGR03767 family metallophosphoesterase n=1 Tax=Nocardioides mangrovi TaxID=2874580 RepID=A0ABS7U8F4_9ACTN|nr:TIGR03767 family metallophosphoesterase [Nocardioides mangrovi]MBZ5737016.1 TIGR03767 family metallophosphoesterase [Nocardioides mangrovi]
MQISRRDLFKTSAVLGGTLALGGRGLADAAVAGTTSAPRATAKVATLAKTLDKGTPGAGGWVEVVELAGEPHRVRTGLGASAGKKRAAKRKGLLAFAQLSDVHVIDAQSPVRVEYADEGVSSSAYRPQEMLSAHVADAMVREINAIGTGPVTGKPLAFALQTGDNSDTTQYNEIRWNIDILDGQTVRPDSGDLTKVESVMDQDPAYYNASFWHPDGTPDGLTDDIYRSTYGFPTVPGLLDAARASFQAEGLDMPWYAAMGNHDGLVQGNFTVTDSYNAQAISATKKVWDPSGTVVNRPITADPDRRLLHRTDWVAEHFTTAGTPVGHGFTAENQAKGTAYYTFDQGKVRFIVLDTVATFGDKGALDAAQFAWLKKLLARSTKKLVVVASHHPLASFSDHSLAGQIKNTLLKYDNVIAWVNGHTHTNQIWAHPKKKKVKGKKKPVSGFWEINTASHIDWPQQSRLIEIVDNKDGTVSIFTTMLDHAAATTPDLEDLSDPMNLASISRLITANDYQERDNHRRGARNARNVELLVPAPAFLR